MDSDIRSITYQILSAGRHQACQIIQKPAEDGIKTASGSNEEYGAFSLSSDGVVYEENRRDAGNQYAGQTDEIEAAIVIIGMMAFYEVSRFQ